jgi:drug/metabolite transporter superfamily protein YnfA
MAETVVAQLKEGPGDVLRTVKNKPFTALVVGVIVLALVVLLEIFFPGAITGRIRALFGMVGIKGAA